MAYVVKRTFGTEGERLGIGIQSEELIRRIKWGSNWTTLRMCLRYAIVPPNDLGTLSNVRFFVGFCSGTNQRDGYYSAYTKSALGFRIAPENLPDDPGPLYYAAGSGNPYYYRNYNNGYAQWHYNGSYYLNLQPVDGGNPSIPTVYGSATQRRVMTWVEIKKPGAPYGNATQYTVRQGSSTLASSDMTTDQFLQNCLKTSNYVGSQSFQVSSAQLFTAPISEADAPFDCITLTWQASVPLEFYDILLFDKYGPLL